MTTAAKLLFHSPCFDGIVSAVIAGDFLRRHEHWVELELEPVNYDLNARWVDLHFDGPVAIVDFLFHPDASFWVDHHRTSFLTASLRREYLERRSERFIYDDRADSCAGLLWRRLFDLYRWRNERYAELVSWAEKIDSARYATVAEAFAFHHPALKISMTLALSDDDYCRWLVRSLTDQPLADVAASVTVRDRFALIEPQLAEGLKRFRRSARLRDGIAVFNVDGRGTIVSRYAPYRVFPHARYSIGYVRLEGDGKITAMRNPWIDFESVALGDIFARFGGGGHQRVASLRVSDDTDVEKILAELVAAVEEAEGSLPAAAAR